MNTFSLLTNGYTDTELLEKTLGGDSNAYGMLMQKYQGPLFDLARRVLGDPSEAEDVLQEVSLESYKHLSSFRRESKFSTWLYSILMNRARNRLRHRKILRFYSLDIRRATRDGFRPPEMSDRRPGLDRVTSGRLEIETLQNALSGLPLLQRTIFVMHYFQDQPLDRIAENLGRPLGTIKVYLHRARRRLQQKLKPAESPAPRPCAAPPEVAFSL